MKVIKDNYNSEKEVTCGKCDSTLLVDPKKGVWSEFDLKAPGYYRYTFQCPLCEHIMISQNIMIYQSKK